MRWIVFVCLMLSLSSYSQYKSFIIGVKGDTLNRVGNDGNNIYHSGDSTVINALGEQLYYKAHEEDIFTITLQKETLEDIRTRFPFWKDADAFTIINE